jgi:hypothetical protein
MSFPEEDIENVHRKPRQTLEVNQDAQVVIRWKE